jgi:colicin import membrane protein
MKQITNIEEVNLDNAPSIYTEKGLKPFIRLVRDELSTHVPDLSTDKGRKEVASLAFKVSKSKSAIEKVGREYLKKLKEQPKIVEAELRDFIKEMDKLRDETRKPLTEWEEEQAKIKAEEEARISAEKLAAQIEIDHEIALLLDEKYTQEKERVKAEQVQKQQEYEAKLKAEAAAQAEKEKAEAIEREKAAQARAIRAEQLAKQQAEAAEKSRIESEARAKQAVIDAAEKAKQDEIDRQKAAQEAERIEQERREANKRHIGKIRRQTKEDLILLGLSESIAKSVVMAIHDQKIRNLSIKY